MAESTVSIPVYVGKEFGTHFRVWRLTWEDLGTTKANKPIWRSKERYYMYYPDVDAEKRLLCSQEYSHFIRNVKLDSVAVWTEIVPR